MFLQEALGRKGSQSRDNSELNALKERVKTLSSEKTALEGRLKKLSQSKKVSLWHLICNRLVNLLRVYKIIFLSSTQLVPNL